MKNLFLIFFIGLLTTFSYTQNIESSSFKINDSIKKEILGELQARISNIPNQDVIESNDSIKITYYSENGIYQVGCCPPKFYYPKERKLLKWLRKDYLKSIESTTRFYNNNFQINISFSQIWNPKQIDSIVKIQDSLNNENRFKKIGICNNIFWSSTSSKQVIPFYSEKLNCSVFFEIPKSFGGFRELDYSFGIPHFEPFDDQIEFVSQIAALTLGIKETCINCGCK